MFEPDQYLFKKFMHLVSKFNSSKNKKSDSIVYLKALENRFMLLASALAESRIEILQAEREGGCIKNVFFLPENVDFFDTIEENLKFYFFRIVFMSVSFNRKTINNETILAAMKTDYPPVYEFYNSVKHKFGYDKSGNLIPDYWLYGHEIKKSSAFGSTTDVNEDDIQKDNLNVKTELKSKAVEEAQVINVDKKSQEEYVLTHNFEKVDTAEEFSGQWRSFDGDDSLEKDADALNELNLRHMVRVDEEVHSVYQADFRNIDGIAESRGKQSKEPSVYYDEWSTKKKKYLENYCRVYLKKILGNNPEYISKTLSENNSVLVQLRKKFSQIHQKRIAVNKMPEGEDLDIDELVNMMADIKSGHTPNENIYLSKRKRESEISIMFLVDFSLSTDSYAAGNRIIDIEKQSVILFGQVLHEYNINFSIAGFYSKTRNNCAFLSIKGFKDDWIKARNSIGSIDPQGYTRIGPALRHANTLLNNEVGKTKWLILLSDGKPNDYDVYEGKYGVSDIKQALRELHESQINTYAIAIESSAKYYLPQMFGQNHYNILSDPNMLLNSLTTLYKRIQNQ